MLGILYMANQKGQIVFQDARKSTGKCKEKTIKYKKIR